MTSVPPVHLHVVTCANKLDHKYACDIQSMKEAVSNVSQQLAVLVDMLAAVQPGRAREHIGNDSSEGSTEVLHAVDCVQP